MFDFDDINLIPKKCVTDTRATCDTSVMIGNKKFKLPIIPANMEAVINEDLAIKLALNNYFYIMHRFNIDIAMFTKRMQDAGLISSISIGVTPYFLDVIKKLKTENAAPDYITIDIAHGHANSMERVIKTLRDTGIDSFIIAGNVASAEAVLDLEEWGADASKVGIGPGSACTTWNATGFGSRNKQAYFIQECAKVSKKMIIADGGIKHHGDIAKAMVLGADLVMIGGMLAGFIDSPGTIVEFENKKFKEFWGSASEFQQKNSRIEGKKYLIELKNSSVLQEYLHITESLQSAISYAGGTNLKAFSNVEYIIPRNEMKSIHFCYFSSQTFRSNI